MHKIEVFEDYTPEDIKLVFKEYWSNVSLDLREFEDYIPEKESIWYRIEVDGSLAGYFSFEEYSEDTRSIHVCILEGYRPLKNQIVLELKRTLKKTFPDNIKYIIALIPKQLSKTVVFALENDFDFLEMIKSDIGKIFIMGISMERFLEEVKE